MANLRHTKTNLEVLAKKFAETKVSKPPLGLKQVEFNTQSNHYVVVASETIYRTRAKQ